MKRRLYFSNGIIVEGSRKYLRKARHQEITCGDAYAAWSRPNWRCRKAVKRTLQEYETRWKAINGVGL